MKGTRPLNNDEIRRRIPDVSPARMTSATAVCS